MSFISAGFFMAMALTACLYYLIPKKYQWELLLFVSFGFYATYGIRYMGYILFTIITSYCITRLMAAQKEKLMRRRWLIFGLVSNFGILVFLKYVNFTILNLTSLFSVFHQAFPLGKLSIVMPLGISFYTFQTMSYVIDVYQKKYEPETNIFRLALFTAYLPQLLQGPIGRYDRLAPQLFEPHDFNLKNIEYGAQRIAWGLAKKLILADRAYVFSKAVFADLNTYSGMYVIVALLTFSIYEYCDFSGGIDVVIGVSELFGIRLDENFRQPYFAHSVTNFWARWHISLSSWFRDYVYVPLGAGRRGEKRKAFNVMAVYTLSGLWHGAALKYVAWGMLNGALQVVEGILPQKRPKRLIKLHHVANVLWTDFLILITMLIFRATSMSAALGMLWRIPTAWRAPALATGFSGMQALCLGVCMAILFAIELLHEKRKTLTQLTDRLPLLARGALYVLAILAIAVFGIWGPGYSAQAFIYFQF